MTRTHRGYDHNLLQARSGQNWKKKVALGENFLAKFMFDVGSWKLENTPIEIQISGNHEGRVVAFLYVAKFANAALFAHSSHLPSFTYF